jgi:hypothetical protein
LFGKSGIKPEVKMAVVSVLGMGTALLWLFMMFAVGRIEGFAN